MIFGLFGGDKKRIAETVAVARAGDTGRSNASFGDVR